MKRLNTYYGWARALHSAIHKLLYKNKKATANFLKTNKYSWKHLIPVDLDFCERKQEKYFKT